MVHIGEISFCDKKAFNIKSDDTKKYILNTLEQKYNLKIIAKHHEKFDIKLLPNLNANPHLICLRSNGNPYFLYLTKLNFVNYCIFIDKKVQQGYFSPRMIITRYHFDDSLFEDTVLDGEMVKKNGEKWIFLINDMYVHKGLFLKDYNLVKRINLIYSMLASEFKADTMDVSRFQVKKFFKYDEIQYMIEEHIPSLQYTCRGMYFKPLFLRFKDILMNFDDNLIKKVERNKYKHLKNFLLLEDKSNIEANQVEKDTPVPIVTQNTQKFLARKTNNPDIYELFTENGVFVDIACIPSMKLSKYMRTVFTNKNSVDKVEIECEFSAKFNKWTPIIVS